MNFELVPLLKGLKIGRISTELWEVQDFEFDQSSQINKYHKGQRVVVDDQWEMLSDTPAEEIDGMEGYRFVRSLQIPMNLRACVQDVDVKGIKVRHKLTFVVRLINPDTHESQASLTLCEEVVSWLTILAPCHGPGHDLHLSELTAQRPEPGRKFKRAKHTGPSGS